MKILSFLFVMLYTSCIYVAIGLFCYVIYRKKKSKTKGVDEKQINLYVVIELLTIVSLLSVLFYILIERAYFFFFFSSPAFLRSLIPGSIVFGTAEHWRKELRNQLDARYNAKDEANLEDR